ncbi:helix-turn-helix transcriptional regulator [Streptomyces sp. PSKA30]|uniref:helix-turn-helix transcriptional regulator n=1 Tax=Streptomyces sp. PSKA30 TaxID=2874597 RepID=UPI001CD05362|nr:helix-turn-helix transcriptional regulator [Streptomyces sp. PSKA30]MBZ9645027.1 helix-turn-helix transcriptional regulator [Streptomyces sp. PSKA30]
MKHAELGSFLRTRRDKVRPPDVGIPDCSRRRVPGLRRDEVARLSGMSVDYYVELEQGRGQSPSDQILMSLARALRLNADETAYLMHLAGYRVPLGDEPIEMQQALLQLLDQLADTPAMVITDLHQVVIQNRLSKALIGVHPTGGGLEANFAYQWFASPVARMLFPVEDHPRQSQALVSDLRAACARRGNNRASANLINRLRHIPEFEELWRAHEVGVPHEQRKRVLNPALGVVTVSFNTLYTADAEQRLLWMAPVEERALDQLRELDEDAWATPHSQSAVTAQM